MINFRPRVPGHPPQTSHRHKQTERIHSFPIRTKPNEPSPKKGGKANIRSFREGCGLRSRLHRIPLVCRDRLAEKNYWASVH